MLMCAALLRMIPHQTDRRTDGSVSVSRARPQPALCSAADSATVCPQTPSFLSRYDPEAVSGRLCHFVPG